MTPLTNPYARVSLCVALLAGMAGCGNSLQHGQGAGTMGTNAEIGAIKLRNVYVERPADGTYQPGEDARVALSLFTDEPIQDSLIAVTSSHAREVRLHWDQACDGEAETVSSIPLHRGSVPAPIEKEVLGHLPYYLTVRGFGQEVLAGTTVPLTFTFTDAGTGTLQAKVQGREKRDKAAHYACLATPIGLPGSS